MLAIKFTQNNYVSNFNILKSMPSDMRKKKGKRKKEKHALGISREQR